jgi:beta-hydroxylase
MAIGLTGFFTFVLGSLFYVFKFRGNERYENFNEYIRKGWPLFSPTNCLLYLFTQARARKPIMDIADFPELSEIQKNWQTIREEVLNLHNKGYFEQTKNTESGAYYDVGFRTFYKYGWSKFYVTWYGYTHKSALELCPKTVEILKRVPTVNGAMFSVLPVGSQLTRHLDPLASSLRYHLGLVTPNDNSCFINVDGKTYSWRDGEAFLFDETYLHYAKNNSDKIRLILMCDVERPMFFIGPIINFIFKIFMRATVVPNLEGDARGAANAIFAGISPILQKTKALKQTNKPLYLFIKHSVNFTLILIVIAIVVAAFNLISYLVTLI